jgi:4-amino-4-deoxy-L-arabinose transferase-like glycosyltransferase
VAPAEPVQRWDYFFVAIFTTILYAVVLGAGGPLTLHEGVLPQTTKAMLANHDWMVPRYGDAPWLERPPLPQWISCGICAVLGGCDQEWNVRVGPAIAGLTTVLLTVWLAGRLFGRAVGILSGLVLSTMYNFVRYSTLAEADIFLAPIVAGTLCVFAYTEILCVPPHDEKHGILGKRPWHVLLFFALLGMTNLAKGLAFGTVIALGPIVVYLLWEFRWQSMMVFLVLFGWASLAKWLHLGDVPGLGTAIAMGPLGLFLLWNFRCYARYLWLWGWLAFALIALPWPLLVYQRFPDAVEVWKFDLFGRFNEHYLAEPPWYYLACLTWVSQPWSIAAFVGLGLTFRNAWRNGSPADRFVWCWAWIPLLVFSLSDGKHHHYMLHYLAAWAIFAAQAIVWGWQKVAAKWQQRWGIPAALALTGEIALAGFSYKLPGPTWLLPLVMAALPLLIAGMWWFSLHRRPAAALVGTFALLFLVYAAFFIYKGAYLHRSREDTAFLCAVRRTVPLDQPLMINSADEALEGLRMQFYIGDTVYFLHNLSFVLDDRVGADDVFVVTRYNRMLELTKYGHVEELMRCKQSRREQSETDRWALFRLHLREGLPRKNAHVPISPMQAMYRSPGPTLD